MKKPIGHDSVQRKHLQELGGTRLKTLGDWYGADQAFWTRRDKCIGDYNDPELIRLRDKRKELSTKSDLAAAAVEAYEKEHFPTLYAKTLRLKKIG